MSITIDFDNPNACVHPCSCDKIHVHSLSSVSLDTAVLLYLQSSWTGLRRGWTRSTWTWRTPRKIWRGWRNAADCVCYRGNGKQIHALRHFGVKLVCNVISTLQCIFDRSRKFRRGGKFEKTWRMSEDGRMASDGRRITIGRNAESNGPMISRYPWLQTKFKYMYNDVKGTVKLNGFNIQIS